MTYAGCIGTVETGQRPRENGWPNAATKFADRNCLSQTERDLPGDSFISYEEVVSVLDPNISYKLPSIWKRQSSKNILSTTHLFFNLHTLSDGYAPYYKVMDRDEWCSVQEG